MANEAQPGTWLTARRVRAHGLLIGAILWSVYLWTLATPGLRDRNDNLKGTDFLHFYVLGWLAREHRGVDLYDMNAQALEAGRLLPQAAGIRYLPLYPPQVSLFLEPLASFSYAGALTIWWISNALLYGMSCYGLWHVCPGLRAHGAMIALLAAAFPPFFHLIAWGQTSGIAIGCFTVVYLVLRRRLDFLAGLALGCLVFKPQLGLAAAIVFAAIGAWKIVAGASLSAFVQLSLGVLYYGVEPLRTWFRTLLKVRQVLPLLEPRPYQTHSLRSFWTLLVPWPALSLCLYVATAILVLVIAIAMWRRSQTVPLSLRYSSLLLTTVLVSPHLTVYDLVILAPALLLLSDWLLSQAPTRTRECFGTLVYLVYVLPLVGPLARWTHVQLSVIAMCILLYLIGRVSGAELRNAQPTDTARIVPA